MTKVKKDNSPSKQVAIKTIYAALKILKQAGGSLPSSEIMKNIRQTVNFNEWENTRYEKSGHIRWEAIFHFYSIDCVKAGFIRKENGVWYLTEEGEKMLKSHSPQEILETATLFYRAWAADGKTEKIVDIPEPEIEDIELEVGSINYQKQLKVKLEATEEEALAGLKSFLNFKNPYEFQDIIAALLRGMSYFTNFISARGKDGGIDIIAYKDPLGSSPPRTKVQVKHKPESQITVAEIRSLIGVLNKPGDVGLFVTSGTFSKDAEREARSSHTHVELIDINRFIKLWKEFYNRMPDEDKNMLPIHPIYFLGTIE
jgi:restriction system protein